MTEGGSAASDQIGLEMGSPPSAFGISPARGAKGTYSKVSLRREMSRSDRRGVLPLRPQWLVHQSVQPIEVDVPLRIQLPIRQS